MVGDISGVRVCPSSDASLRATVVELIETVAGYKFVPRFLVASGADQE